MKWQSPSQNGGLKGKMAIYMAKFQLKYANKTWKTWITMNLDIILHYPIEKKSEIWKKNCFRFFLAVGVVRSWIRSGQFRGL